ncbi:MAG: glycosyltransferase [Candidatus Omnitrophica bacterium]|nr:glycosyltransferase [Candidatus Omnitrophota bacterium]
MPLVSVLVMTYNQKEFIGQCIDSALLQDYENIEIVVGDNGSTDGTQEIEGEYCKRYPQRITLKLQKKHIRVARYFNETILGCKGKYITFLFGDDLFLPGKIKKQVEYMEAHPECTIAYHNAEIFDSYTGNTLGYFNSGKRYSYQGGVEKLFIYGVFNGPFSMARREKTPRHGFNEMIPFSIDWLYWIETLAKGGEIHYINEILARYRRHKNNITITEPTVLVFWEKFLTMLIAVIKYPRLIRYLPNLMKDVGIRLSHHFLKAPEGVIIIKGKSLLRAYKSPE